MISKVQNMLISVGIVSFWLLHQYACELYPRSMRCVHATLLCCVCYKALHVLEGLRRWCEQVLTYFEPFLRFCGIIVEVPQLFGKLFESLQGKRESTWTVVDDAIRCSSLSDDVVLVQLNIPQIRNG